MKVLAAIGIVSIALVASAWFIWGPREDGQPLAVGGTLPEIELDAIADMPGSGVALRGPAGKPLVINAFASWCIPCRDEHPLLIEIAERYDVMLIGINVGDLPENAAAFLAEMGNPYDMVGADPNRETFYDLGLVGMPQTLVADAQGKVLLNGPGPIDRRFVDEVLPALLGDRI